MTFTGTVQLAKVGYQLTEDRFFYDPQQLPTRRTVWEGTKTKLLALQQSLPCQTELTNVKGQLYRLVATRVGGAALEHGQHSDPVWSDKWSIHTDALEKQIWAHPLIFAAAKAYDSENPNKFKRELEKYAEDSGAESASSPACLGNSNPLAEPYQAFVVYQVADLVLIELGRGCDHYEEECLTLRRVRSISTGFRTAMPLYTARLVYTSAQLSLPDDVRFSLPTFPANPAQAVWGWRLKQQQSEFLAPGRIEQSFEWVLAAWSTLLYEQSTANFPE